MEASEFSKRMRRINRVQLCLCLCSTFCSGLLQFILPALQSSWCFPLYLHKLWGFSGAVCTVTSPGCMHRPCKSLMLLPGQQCSLQLLWTVKEQQRRQSVNSLSWLPLPVPDPASASARSCRCTWGFAEPRTPPSTSRALPGTTKAVTRFGIASFLRQTSAPDGRRSLCLKGHDAALLASVAKRGEQSLLFALWD